MLTGILTFFAVLIAIPIAVPAIEAIAACVFPPASGSPPRPLPTSPSPTLAVLIPAHNEEAGITKTIKAILVQLREGDRLVVIADNCSDSTADMARRSGAEVIERKSETQRGKGFALAVGIEHLCAAPPDVVVIIDADTPPAPGALASVVRTAADHQLPVQALYLMASPREATAKSAISAFAFCLKNQARPLGAQSFGIPSHLTGTGMAFPWGIIRQARLATGNIVEDMQLGIDLAIAGYPAKLCPDALVTGTLPDASSAATTQRTRWEHGHLQMILQNVPKLLWQAIRQRRLELIGLALDLAVPPLALLVSAWAVVTLAAGVGLAAGLISPLPLQLAGASGALLAASILLAWARFARSILPFATLLAVPLYIAWKIPLYGAFLFRRQRDWVRTARS